jgi:uncharacterized protein YlxP (DUF503 family)
MAVSALQVELHFGAVRTPRQRQQLVQGIVQHLRHRFPVAVAEIGPTDRLADATLGVAAVARTRQEAREILVHVADALDGHPHAEVTRRRLDDLA